MNAREECEGDLAHPQQGYRRNHSAVFSLVSEGSDEEDDGVKVKELRCDTTAADGPEGVQVDSPVAQSGSTTHAATPRSTPEENGVSFEGKEEPSDLLDLGLAAAQDSVKTVITQSFRVCAFCADSVASLVLTAHENIHEATSNTSETLKDGRASPKEQSAGASSAEKNWQHGSFSSIEDEIEPPVNPLRTASPPTSESHANLQTQAMEEEERRLDNLQRSRNMSNQGTTPPTSTNSDAFASLFRDLENGHRRNGGLQDIMPSSLPSEFELNRLQSSGSIHSAMDFSDAPQTDDDAYTDLDATPQVEFHASDENSGVIRVTVEAIGRKIKNPIKFARSWYWTNSSDAAASSTPRSFYMTPPITPFEGGNVRNVGRFRDSLRRMSIGSFGSIKDAIGSWRKNRRLITAQPVPNASSNQTGLFEDVEIFLLEGVDVTFNSVRDLFRRLKREGPKSVILGNSSPNLPDDAQRSLESHDSTRSASRSSRIASSAVSIVTLRTPRGILVRSLRKIGRALNPIPYLESASQRFVNLENVDELRVGDIITNGGFPFEEHLVTTQDGYILRLERIPNRGSNKVLYLQHGVMDSAFAWVANGAGNALAFRAYDAGYDVYLGNFRGVALRRNSTRRHVDENISNDDYWDFSVNEHAMQDIPAFVEKVREIKRREIPQEKRRVKNSELDKPVIIAVAHSMGGMAMLMYVLQKKQRNLKHHLDGLVLVSPAGIHINSPIYAQVGGRLVDLTVAKMLHSLRLPNDSLTKAAIKVVHDIKRSVPRLEDFISLVLVKMIGGDQRQPRRGPFSAVQLLAQNVLTCGTSTKVFTHLRQLITTKEFRAFDYEPSARPNHYSSEKGKNMEVYGSAEPPEYTSLYGLIDIPVQLIAGLGDNLIGPENVLRHFTKMRENGVDVELESFEKCGHIDFTLGLNTKVLHGLLAALENVEARAEARRREKIKEKLLQVRN